MIFNTAQTGINTVVRSGLDIGFSGNVSTPSWRDQLQPASYKKVPFGVLSGNAHFGRRNAVHEYPFRDGAWVEDLGRSARKINVTGFLVGDDCIAQRAILIKACESAGDGELVHPTLGRMKVSLLGPVGMTERWDHGRVFELEFSFIESGQRIFPTSGVSTSDKVLTQSTIADLAAAQDFATRAASALRQGAAVVGQAVTTAAIWYRKAQRLSNDATNMANLAKSLPGELGRFSAGARMDIDPTATITTSIAAAAASRQNVVAASDTMNAGASSLTAASTTDYASSAQALAASVLAGSVNPADSLRLLSSLADLTPTASTDQSLIGQAMNVIQKASSDLFRRAAVVALARASSTYQSSSQEDALAVRTQVLALLDNEITLAADQGDNGSFSALRGVRIAVAQDLTARSIGLPSLMLVKSNQPLPSLALAQRLYRDPTRADELVARTAVIHPAFMPVSFQALSV